MLNYTRFNLSLHIFAIADNSSTIERLSISFTTLNAEKIYNPRIINLEEQ